MGDQETGRSHVHVWVHVIGDDRQLVCKCVCGRSLTESQIVSMRVANGVS